MELTLEQQRHVYAEELRAVAPVRRKEAVVAAFATVPREEFAGPGPWLLHPPFAIGCSYRTSDSDPRRLYHNVLVCIDERRDLNIGQPSLWARVFDTLALSPRERVIQVGTGTGYYSAVLAEIVGRAGRVFAVEHDQDLAIRASKNLANWPQVEVIAADGVAFDAGEVDTIVSFAGVTHPPPLWLDQVVLGGEILLPLTGAKNRGLLLKLVRGPAGFDVEVLGLCGFFHCIGARSEWEALQLDSALAELAGSLPEITKLGRGAPQSMNGVWFVGEDYWLGR